ncbi:LacI family DNA-binding transcriptional regulator [bacterium]|nr:LacI family DNA-binding transcriptional regulator [bacterium]
MAGVSKTTVSFIINGKAGEHQISAETIRRVQAVIDEHGYVPSEFARGFRLRQTRTIGLVVGDVNNRFLSLLEKTIETEIRNTGFNLIIASTEDNAELETEAIRTMLSKFVDALILVSVHPDNMEHNRLNTRGIPIVYLDRMVEGQNTVCVTTDNYAGAFQLTEQFTRQSLKRIAFIGGLETLSNSKDRYRGYEDALKQAGIDPDPALVIHGEFTVEGGYHSAEQLLTQKSGQPDAILTASYTLLEGLLQYMHNHDPDLLGRIKLATFDDHPLLDFMPFKINAVLQDANTLGKAAFDCVMKSIHGEGPVESLVVPPMLIIRDQIES